MINFGTAPNKALILALSLATVLACGGSEEATPNDTDNVGDANKLDSSAGGSTGSVTVPDTCQRQAECPTGYTCVPPAESFTTALDPSCYGPCSGVCDQAGEFAEECEQDCARACTGKVPPADGALNGKCLANQADPDDGTGGTGGTGNNSSGSGGSSSNTNTSIQWANTWTVDVEYTVNCDWANTAQQSGTQKYTLTMQVTGSNSSPKASLSGGYELEGTGGDDRMTLTGDFPLRNWKGETGTVHSLNSPNEATIRMTTVASATEASGTIEGQWDASGGWKCTTSNGKITLSR